MNLQNVDHDNGDLRVCLRALSADARRTLEAHPSTEELVRYHERTLDPEQAEGVREHLALCPECAQRGLDLAGFVQVGQAVVDDDLCAAARPPEWAATRQALVRKGLLAQRGARRRVIELLRPPRLAYAMAAVFFLASVTLSFWIVTVHRTLDDLARPRANVQLVDLFPQGAATQRDPSAPQPGNAAAPEDSLVLILNLLDPGSYPGYGVEIADPNGQVIWTSDTLARSAAGDFTVLVSRRRLPAERYLVRLYGIDGSRKDPLADYTLRFAPP